MRWSDLKVGDTVLSKYELETRNGDSDGLITSITTNPYEISRNKKCPIFLGEINESDDEINQSLWIVKSNRYKALKLLGLK